MSYILDALKKADAERERDAAAVPDLYAQADAARGARAAARLPGWVLPALAAGAVALAVLAWAWFSAAPGDAPPSPVMAQAPPALPAPPPPMPAAPPAMPAPARATAPAPLAAQAPVPVARPVSPPPPPRPVAMPAPTPAATPPKKAPSLAAAPAMAPKPAPAASAPSEARLLAITELPPDIRSQLPTLVVGGSVYSPSPASRIVILNGQVFREGDQPVDGLSVEQIRLKSTVLAFRGLRFEIKH